MRVLSRHILSAVAAVFAISNVFAADDISKSTFNFKTNQPSQIYSLDDCIAIAINNSIQLRVAEKSMRLGEMRIFEARRNFLPTASIVYDNYHGVVNGRHYIGRKQYIEGQQPVYHGGEIYFAMKQAEVNLEVTKTEYKRIKNDLILQVKKNYYSLLKAKENARIQSEIAGEVDKRFGMARAAYEAGLVAKVEYLNVASQANQAKFQQMTAEGDEKIAELILKQSMNIDHKENIGIRPVFGFKKAKIDFDTILWAAFVNRAEVRINSLMIQYYNLEESGAKAKGWPKVDLLGNWGLAKEEYTSEDSGYTNPLAVQAGAQPIYDEDQKLEQQYYWGIKVGVPLWGSTGEYSFTHEQWVPVISAYQGTEAWTHTWKLKLLDKLSYYSDRQSASVDLERARQELNKAKQDVTLEVSEQCFNYEKALLHLDTSASKVTYKEKEVEVNRMRRELDEIPDSDLIQTIIELGQEKFDRTQAIADCYIAVASINKAVGQEDYMKLDRDGGEVLGREIAINYLKK